MVEKASTVVPPGEPWSLRAAAYRVLDNGPNRSMTSRVVDLFLVTLIIISIVAVILESVESLEVRYETLFYWIEVITVAVFTVEYVLRVWSSVEDPACSDAAGPRPYACLMRRQWVVMARTETATALGRPLEPEV